MLVLFRFVRECGTPNLLLACFIVIALMVSYMWNDCVHHNLVALTDI
jgi:hypothetical protein